MYDGAVMSLVFDARPATKDVDAIFEPTNIIRSGIKAISDEFNLPEDWLNDGIKGFLVNHEKEILLIGQI